MDNVKHDVPPELAEEFDKIMDERRALETVQVRLLQLVILRDAEVEARRRAWWDRVCRELGVGADERWEYDRAARVIRRVEDGCAAPEDRAATRVM